MFSVSRTWAPRRLIVFGSMLATVFSLFTATAPAAPRGEFSEEDEAIIRSKWPEAMSTPSGLRYVIEKDGTGEKPRQRQKVSVYYRGTFLTGKEFSSNIGATEPFAFVLGTRKVIAGWEEALADMRLGEKRTLIIPYTLAYGLLGRPPDIPNRATLVFEVELVGIN